MHLKKKMILELKYKDLLVQAEDAVSQAQGIGEGVSQAREEFEVIKNH